MDFRKLLLVQHARAHAAEVDGVNLSMQDVVFGGVTPEQMRQRPQPTANSLAFVLWHVTRAEDVGMNAVIAQSSQVLDDGAWASELKVLRRDVGTGMTDAEIDSFNQTIQVPALFAYRADVGRRTQVILRELSPMTLDEVIDSALVQRLLAEGTFGPHAGWAPKRWVGKKKEYTLNWTVLAHTFLHFGEAYDIRHQLGLPTL